MTASPGTIIAPALTCQPLDQTVVPGGTATFSVAASGTAPLTYQWLLNGASIPGATNSSFTLSNVQTADAGTYSAQVANSAGTALSSNAVLTVTQPRPEPPAITTQPSSLAVAATARAAFGVAASGTAP